MSLLDWFRRPRQRAAIRARLPSQPASAATAVADVPPPAPDVELDETTEPGWWEPRGTPVLVAPPPHDALTADDIAVCAHLQRVLENAELDLPMLPQIAQRALVKLQDQNVDFRELATLIGEDQAISAEVLRVVNSAAYARLFKVNQLDAAFTRLGAAQLRSLLVAMTLKGMAIRIGGPVRSLGEELWQRSIVSAVLVSDLSRTRGIPEGEAFLVGLLHDIGNLAILRLLHDWQRTQGGSVSRSLFERLSHTWHQPLGARLAEAWRLPVPLPAIVGDHHRAPAPEDPLAGHRLLVQFADVVCALLSYGPYVPYDFFALPCTQALEITDTPPTRAWLIALPALIAERAGVF